MPSVAVAQPRDVNFLVIAGKDPISSEIVGAQFDDGDNAHGYLAEAAA